MSIRTEVIRDEHEKINCYKTFEKGIDGITLTSLAASSVILTRELFLKAFNFKIKIHIANVVVNSNRIFHQILLLLSYCLPNKSWIKIF